MKTTALLIALLCYLCPPLAAQEQTGNLQGTVVDSSDAVLPGVTVTVAGASILGGSMIAVTNENGAYRLRNIPVGIYTVSFDLEGFTSTHYERVAISADATFTINAALQLGGVAESVTVVGESPIIETAKTDVGFTFTKDVMEKVPNARDVWAMVAQAPGVTASSVNVGGTDTGNQLTFRGNGVDPRQNTYMLNGANVTDNTNNGASQFFFDVDSFEEMGVELSSHSAEIQTPGMVLNIVPKSGTNTLHGGASVYYNNDSVSSDNVDAALRARGVDRASNLHKYFDSGFDIGGPIVRDRVWFYGAYRWQEVEKFVTGTQNPDGSFPIDRTYLWYPSGKINWRALQSHNLSLFFNMAQKKRFNRGLSLTCGLDCSYDQQGAPIARLFTLRDDWTIGNKLLVSFKANIMDQGFELRAHKNIDVANTPSRYDAATRVRSDAPASEFGIGKNLKSVGVTASYFADEWLGGQHELKLGLELLRMQQFGNQGGSVAKTTYPADHQLTFFNGVPLQTTLYGSDASRATNPAKSAFVQDSWKRGPLTLNLGVRWDWQANSLDDVTAPASRFFPDPVHQAATGNLITWNTFAPRLGVVYDLTGDAKTLLKGSYSRYYWQLWTDKIVLASSASTRAETYTWNDLNGDLSLQFPSELGALLSVSDPARNKIDIQPDLKPTQTDELTAGVARQLLGNLSIEASYMYRKDKNLTWTINTGISPTDYTAISGTDPGVDGVEGTADDGGQLTFYELAAAKTALSPNLLATRPGFEQEYHGFALTVHRRMADNWQFVGSYNIGLDKENYKTGSYQNPQDIDKLDGTRIEASVPWVAKFMGSYVIRDFTFSGMYQAIAGTSYAREVNSTSALGRRLNQGNVVALAETRSAHSYGTKHVLDLRLGYELPLGERARLAFDLDAFNILNINAVTNQQVVSGATYGQVISFIPPRILRFGAKVRF